MLKTLQRQTQKAATKIRQAFRAKLGALDTQSPVQLMQLQALEGETLQAAEFVQQFGFTSSPPGGTQCIVLPLGGKTVHSVIIATENGSFRVAVAQGETCVYNQWGAKITLKKDKIVEVDCDHFIVKAKESVDIQTKSLSQTASQGASYAAPSLTFGGIGGKTAKAVMQADIEQQGRHTSTGDQIAGGISQIRHTHRENGDGGGRTDAPD